MSPQTNYYPDLRQETSFFQVLKNDLTTHSFELKINANKENRGSAPSQDLENGNDLNLEASGRSLTFSCSGCTT